MTRQETSDSRNRSTRPSPNDSIAPTVSLVSPTNNSTVSGTVTVLVEANDNVGVSKVDYYLNGALLASTNAAPYSFKLEYQIVS